MTELQEAIQERTFKTMQALNAAREVEAYKWLTDPNSIAAVMAELKERGDTLSGFAAGMILALTTDEPEAPEPLLLAAAQAVEASVRMPRYATPQESWDLYLAAKEDRP